MNPGGNRSVVAGRAATILLLLVLTLIAGGCVSPVTVEQESDWRWKQANPEYRPPYPPDR